MKTDTQHRLDTRYTTDALEALIRETWRDMHAHRRTARTLQGDRYGRLIADCCAARFERNLRTLLSVRRTARLIGRGVL